MVAQAPEGFHHGFGTTVQSPNCRTPRPLKQPHRQEPL